jgi:nucleoside diphosphate kinase
MKQHMTKSNKEINDTLIEIVSAKAVINAIICMAEDEQQIEIANALYGVSSMLDAIRGKLRKRYTKDSGYLSSIGFKLGTNGD